MENITSKGTIFGTLIAQAGPKGDTGRTGDRGLTGEAGYSPIKGVDYFTQEDISEIRKGIEGDLTGEYNKNAIEKTNIFNTNAKETTTSFDLNAENKTKEYNDNALAEIEKYNSNAIEKSNNFDTNFENKTSKFDSNCDEKTKEFNDNNDLGIQNYNNNAKKQMEIFDTNFTEKLEAFNNNAGNKFNGFNTNSDKALAEYNRNHTAKMKEFDDNYDTKTKTFDDNAAAKLDKYNKNTELKEKSFNDNAGTKTETFNSNAADKQNEFDENASDKLAEYNQNAKELINKVEQVQAENETLKAENKLIKEQIPSASVSGNSIHVEDSGTLDFDWKINGNQHRSTREGYNKIDLSSISTEVAGIKALYDNETGYITFNGTPTANYPRFFSLDITDMLNDGEKWTIWQEKAPSGTDKEILLQVIERKSATENTHYYSSASSGNKTSFTVDKTQYSYYLNLLGGTIANIGTLTNYKNRYMLYKGTEDKPYEQYGASPSQKFPSEVETVGSNVNYFDDNAVESKFLNSKTGKTSDNASWRCTDFIEILSKQYNFSWESDSSYFQATVCYYDKNKTFISGDEYGLWGIYSKTFEIPDGANYMKVAHSITVAGKPVIRDKIKLEIGNKRTLYSPFMCGSVEIDVVNKNFLNISNKLDGTLNGITTTTNVNGSIHISGTTTGSGALFKGARVKVGKLKAGTYSFSAKLTGKSGTTSANSALYFRPSYNGKPYAEMHPYANGSVYNNNVTLSSKTEVWLEWYCNTSGISIDADLYVQIERATANTETEQHQSQMVIMPIQQEMLTGDCISNVEHHEWKKLALTGDEDFEIATSSNGFNAFLNRKIISDNSLEDITTYCNNFKSATDINFNLMEDNTIFGGRGYQHQLLIRCDKYTTVEDFKAMLKSKYNSGTPVTIYYKLAEPLDLELTKEQKAVRDTKLYTYKNITNIDVSDELASIDVNYKKDPTTEHDDLQNQIDEIKQLISTTETSALLLDNLQKDVESEVK